MDAARTFLICIAIQMWWTSIAIALVATYFEWSYRKRKSLPKEPGDENAAVPPKPVTPENVVEQKEAS